MKAPDLGCRGSVDNSPLISCEGVGERHLFFIQRPLTLGVCAKLLTRHEKSWPGSDSGQSVHGMPRVDGGSLVSFSVRRVRSGRSVRAVMPEVSMIFGRRSDVALLGPVPAQYIKS